MNITTTIGLIAKATCRSCKVTVEVPGSGPTSEAAELAIHEALEELGWTDGLCPDCAQKKYLNQPTNENTDH